MNAPLLRTLGGYAAASLATALPWPLLLVLAWDEWGGAAAGLVAAARMAPYVLLSWAVGTLGDRVRRDRLVLATLLLRLVLLAGTAVALAAGSLLTAVLLAGLAVASGLPAYPAIGAAVPVLAGDRRARATDALVTIEVSAWVVGPAVGGLLLLPATRAWVPGLAVALVAAAVVAVAGVRLPSPPQERRVDGGLGPMLRSLAGNRPALLALATAGLVNLVASATALALLPLTREAWDQGDAGYGVATAWLGFGALAAPLLWWLTGRRATGLLVLGGATVVAGLTPVPGIALPVLALAGAVAVVVESSVTQTVQVEVPDEHRAGALGVGDSVMVLGALLGSLVAPALVGLGGPRLAFVLCAGACLLAAGAAQARRPVRASSRAWREASSGASMGPVKTPSS
ncbi:MFS transporter [Nocardioides sp.]|uniref:MFS transporter n=1 Tax=Nocardioides sp. TaxID=35761 RepID=UPI003784A641